MSTIDIGLTLLQADLELAHHRTHCMRCRMPWRFSLACSKVDTLRSRTDIDNAMLFVNWQRVCQEVES